jgi:tRNA-specific 2-thiouridylase
LFPLGGLHKTQVREIAEQNGLVNAKKRDSQDICFAPDGDYAAFIERTAGHPSPAGNFVDENGRVLGQHKGFVRYTRGQHKGLGLSIEPPLYVLDKDPATGAIRLGPDAALWTQTLTAEKINWISVPALSGPLRVTAKTRYSQRESAATAEPLEDGALRLTFDEPQRAVTPGQAVVLYDGETVVGGGTITK